MAEEEYEYEYEYEYEGEDIFLPKYRAINKHNKHYKHDKNEINTVKDITHLSDNQKQIDSVTPWQASPSEVSSPSQEAERVSGSRPPQTAISYMKLDIFNNASGEELAENVYHLHAKLSIKMVNTPNWHYASSSLNSEKRMAKRGLRMDNPEHSQHWDMVQQLFAEFKQDYKDVRASKFYQSGQQKGRSIKGLSLVLSRQAGIAVVIKGTVTYPFSLSDKGLTPLQRKRHIILSGTWTDDSVVRSDELNVDDWLRGGN
jgi:hypothetical protein